MPTTQSLIDVLKQELRASGVTYAALAAELGMAESSVKRMFAQADMPLSRVDEICKVLKTDFAELSRRVAEAAPARQQLTVEQERAVVADRKLLLMAICCLSQWTLEQITTVYRVSETEGIRYLAELDRIGIIELRPLNRYRLKVAKTFRWRPHGPVMQYFCEHVVGEYFAGAFDAPGEMLTLVHGRIDSRQARQFNERLQRVAEDFAMQHLADQKLPDGERAPYTLVLSMRSWWFSALRDLSRPASELARLGGGPVRRD